MGGGPASFRGRRRRPRRSSDRRPLQRSGTSRRPWLGSAVRVQPGGAPSFHASSWTFTLARRRAPARRPRPDGRRTRSIAPCQRESSPAVSRATLPAPDHGPRFGSGLGDLGREQVLVARRRHPFGPRQMGLPADTGRDFVLGGSRCKTTRATSRQAVLSWRASNRRRWAARSESMSSRRPFTGMMRPCLLGTPCLARICCSEPVLSKGPSTLTAT